MDIDECRKLLLDKALKIDERNAKRFVDYIVSYRLAAEIRQYSSASIQQLSYLFRDVMKDLEARSPRQEIDMEKCRMLLLNKALQVDARKAQRFVDYIFNSRSPAEVVRYSSGSIPKVRSLFHEVRTYLEAHPPLVQMPPSWGHGHGSQLPQPSPQPQLHPSSSFPGNQFQVPLPHGQPQPWPQPQPQLHPGSSFPGNQSQVLLPYGQPQPQLHPSSSFPGNQAQIPLPHGQPQFDPRFSFNRIQAPFFPFSPIEPVHCGQIQFHPSSSFDGIQPPLLPIGQIRQHLPQIRPNTNFNEIQPPVPPNVHSNALQSAHPNALHSVAGGSSRRSKRCYDLFNGGCKNPKCQDCHWSYLVGMMYELPKHSVETLPMLGEEIRQLLISLRPSVVPIEHLPMIYIEKYGKSLLVMDFKPDGQQLGEKGSYSLVYLLMRLDTIKVIESDGHQCVALAGDALESSGSAADYKLVLAPPNPSHRVTIYIAFSHQSTFTVTNAWDYFRKFGPVTFLQIQGATRGYVSFLYPETVELLLSETRSNCHFILGAQVHIFSSMEKLEWKVSGQEESDKVLDVNVSYEYHIGEKSSSELEACQEKLNNECDKVITADKSSNTVGHGMASEGDNAIESSDVSNRLDKASADQDIDDSGLQDDPAVD